MSLVINDPKHWLDRAEEARKIALTITDLVSRADMLNVAESYERMAERAAKTVIVKVPMSDVLVAGK